jgi:hypothetical protein
MNHRLTAIILSLAALALPVCAADLAPERPRIGKVAIFKAADLRPGMQGTAWTVFAGTTPEPVPVEIVGRWKRHVGTKAGRDPGQDWAARPCGRTSRAG